MSVLLVVSDRPGAGKTSVALALAEVSNRSGHTAHVYYPFTAGDDNRDSEVFAQLANPSLEGWPRSGGSNEPAADDLTDLASVLSSDDNAESLNILEVPSEVGAAGVASIAEPLNARTLVITPAHRGLRASDFSDWSDALWRPSGRRTRKRRHALHGHRSYRRHRPIVRRGGDRTDRNDS